MTGAWKKNLKGRRAVVIGGGVGGLSAAIALAARGARVTVLERYKQPGGKLATHTLGDFRFDCGPTLLTMPHVFAQLFSNAGHRLTDFVELKQIDPLHRAVFADGSHLDVWTDLGQFQDEVAKIDTADADALPRFFRYADSIRQATERPFLLRPFTMSGAAMGGAMEGNPLRNLARIATPFSVDRHLRRYFRSEKLLRVFRRFPTYVGSSPFRAPGTLNVIPAVEWKYKGWYPEGGMVSLLNGLLRLAELCGVKIVCGCTVERIEVSGGKVRGVSGDGFRPVEADIVVSNSDALLTYEKLLEPTEPVRKTLDRLRKLEPSCSGFVLLVGTNKRWPVLRHHTVFFGGGSYREEFRQVDEWKVPAADPTIYVANPVATDPAAAPDGKSALFILVNMPPMSTRWNWTDALVNDERDRILNRLEKRGLKGLIDSIEVEEVRPPQELWERTRAPRGAIYGFAANHRSAAFFRPTNRSPVVSGLYFAGGSCHPGGGVPLVALSGMHAASLAASDWGTA